MILMDLEILKLNGMHQLKNVIRISHKIKHYNELNLTVSNLFVYSLENFSFQLDMEIKFGNLVVLW